MSGRRGCYGEQDELTSPLRYILSQGIKWALALLGVQEATGLVARSRTVLDLTEWTILVRRLWTPFYEQGRHYVQRGISDGVVDSGCSFDAQTWEHLVERYVSEDYAATTPPLLEEPE